MLDCEEKVGEELLWPESSITPCEDCPSRPPHDVGCGVVGMGLQVGNTHGAGDSGFLKK